MKPEKSAKSKGKRRQFSPEFKSEAGQLAQSAGQSIAIVAKDLGISEGNLRNWIKQAAVDAGNGPAGALTSRNGAKSRICEWSAKSSTILALKYVEQADEA